MSLRNFGKKRASPFGKNGRKKNSTKTAKGTKKKRKSKK